ncbi:GLIPR1-like protein 1 [Microcaecilia unicolor]|uniref:GLIPR1-like protein 1 n=1 Tax=Microcaecilia unicolor TaxID=1415580 RepID=A0A6P7YUD0_9AMPH|nr:GLIPR1-like protein 1 [Microcaecilia unicolor]
MAAKRFFCLLLLVTALLFPLCSSARASVPDITDPEFVKLYVDEHNKYRSAVNPPASDMLYMTWDPSLARVARSWGRRCVFEHNVFIRSGKIHPTFKSIGENLWKGGGYPGRHAISAWYSEVQHYDYSRHKCTDVCGHYTQVVWASSYKLGCAAVKCKGHSVTVICNYGPPGNYRGVKPYKEGEPCSQCPGDQCENNLCRNKQRDRIVYHPNWYPYFDQYSWYADLSCDTYCISVLAIRLFFIPWIFVADFYVHKRYPDIISR